MFTRTRDIGDDAGARLRISVAPHPAGAMVTLERRDQRHRPSIWLNLYGAEILSGFLMSARLSTPHPMPDETTEGASSLPMDGNWHAAWGSRCINRYRPYV